MPLPALLKVRAPPVSLMAPLTVKVVVASVTVQVLLAPRMTGALMLEPVGAPVATEMALAVPLICSVPPVPGAMLTATPPFPRVLV